MDVIELHRRSVGHLADQVGLVKPADLESPTPCVGWTLRDLLEHLVAENRGFVSAAGGAGVWDDGSLGEDFAATFRTTADAVLEVFAGPGFPERPITVREFGTFPGGIAIRMQLIDNVAHAWDVATALGVPWNPPADLAEAALEIVLRFPLGRGPGEAFAAEVPLPVSASPADRFLAYCGRDPLGTR